MATVDTTPILKVLLALGALACVAAQVSGIRKHLAHADLATLEGQIVEGRSELSDLDRLATLRDASITRTFACDAKRSLAFIHLYLVDLTAASEGVSAIDPSPSVPLNAARARARASLHDALGCAPLDGDLWLRLAIVLHGLAEPEKDVRRAFDRSRAVAPHEGRLVDLRTRFEPILIR